MEDSNVIFHCIFTIILLGIIIAAVPLVIRNIESSLTEIEQQIIEEVGVTETQTEPEAAEPVVIVKEVPAEPVVIVQEVPVNVTAEPYPWLKEISAGIIGAVLFAIAGLVFTKIKKRLLHSSKEEKKTVDLPL